MEFYKTIIDATPDVLEPLLSRLDPADHYTEDMRQYNGTGDPVVVAAGHPVGQLMRYHDHTFYEINYITRGTCLNMIEGQKLTMHAGDFVLLHPESLHTLYADKTCRAVNFLLDIAWLNGLFAQVLKTPDAPQTDALEFARFADTPNAYKFVFFSKNSSCSELVRRLLASEDLPCRALFREAVMTQLLLGAFSSCSSRLSPTRGISSGLFKQMYTYTASRYDTVTLDELARTFGYCRSYVCKLFKTHTGKSFSQNLIDFRIHHAQILLISTSLPSEQIAREIGYDSVEYFHRLFRRHVGMTPGEYRAKK